MGRWVAESYFTSYTPKFLTRALTAVFRLPDCQNRKYRITFVAALPGSQNILNLRSKTPKFMSLWRWFTGDSYQRAVNTELILNIRKSSHSSGYVNPIYLRLKCECGLNPRFPTVPPLKWLESGLGEYKSYYGLEKENSDVRMLEKENKYWSTCISNSSAMVQ